MTDWVKRAGGCGCAAVLAVILVVSLVAWLMSYFHVPSPTRTLQPVDAVVPPAVPEPVALIDVHAPGRTADELREWSAPLAASTDVSGQALRAYGNAELIARDAWPECHLRWNTLAGLGWVETRHGTYGGSWLKPSNLDATGRPDPKIVGIPLDGTNNTVRIEDTDGGRLDGDTEFDRAVGPLQFIPSTWEHFGLDADGDGVADPQQIDDAALSAAKLLCDNDRDLAVEEDWLEAIYAYNNSRDYVTRVAKAANSYAVPQPANS
ncbi:lytic murein transglycosylase [Corynebacterium sp. SA-MJD20WY100]|uniref:lytic transglycosylase domain-containing protein n=1 Tax=Corynebacterium sp. SA-MJD20WY100 TaxID=3142969 RepID=UPI0032219FE7